MPLEKQVFKIQKELSRLSRARAQSPVSHHSLFFERCRGVAVQVAFESKGLSLVSHLNVSRVETFQRTLRHAVGVSRRRESAFHVVTKLSHMRTTFQPSYWLLK
jgi:hypothetical protein